MTKLLWKLYYKMTLGSEYEATLKRCQDMSSFINQSTLVKTNHFYNSQGEKIRGWHNAPYKFKNLDDSRHPLEIKYN